MPTEPPLSQQSRKFILESLPPNVTIAPVTPTTLPAYRRVITTLLPIPYPPKFYKDSIANPTSSSLALCALWHGRSPSDAESTAIGGIQCRLEPFSTPPSQAAPVRIEQRLYVQTLATLAPYRSLGIATALMDRIITIAITHYSNATENVAEIYAHVWEANEDALQWYVKRGFVVVEGAVEGYYRRLKPSGAKIVRRNIGVNDWLRVKGPMGNETVDPSENAARSDQLGKEGKLANG